MKSLDYDALFAEGLQWEAKRKRPICLRSHTCVDKQGHEKYSYLELYLRRVTQPHGAHLSQS